MNKKQAAVINNTADVSLQALSMLGVSPMLILLVAGLYATYGIISDFIPENAKEFHKKLQAEIPDIQKQFANSVEFRQAVAKTYEGLMKSRHIDKIKILEAVFFEEYIPSDDRKKVELERYYQAIENISVPALEHLYFIKKVIFTRREKRIREYAKQARSDFPQIYTEEYTYQQTIKRDWLSVDIQNWLAENYGLNTQEAKLAAPTQNGTANLEYQAWSKRVGDESNEMSNKFNEYASELISLGIFFTGQEKYNITDFGRRLISIIPTIIADKGESLYTKQKL